MYKKKVVFSRREEVFDLYVQGVEYLICKSVGFVSGTAGGSWGSWKKTTYLHPPLCLVETVLMSEEN